MDNPRITRIERGLLEGARPRQAGCNARLGVHGIIVRVPIIRITAEDGSTGFGFSRATQESVAPLLGSRLLDLFVAAQGATEVAYPIEYALWDLLGKRAGLPAYALAAQVAGCTPPQTPFRVPCYDTSLYIDDLDLSSHEAAAALIAAEASRGYARGHRAFKVKIGRGARHMPLEEGTVRDIAVIHAVRAVAGVGAPLMIDANNGYNLNLAKRVLAETADCRLYWLEEAFHEDAVLYRDLHEWMDRQGLKVLIADGEGDASPRLMDWAQEGVIDVVQRDFSWGFTRLIRITQQLAAWGRLNAPHHYGAWYGNYASCHLAAAGSNVAFVEWDEATIAGLSAPGYSISEGKVTVPAAAGFGLLLDEAAFAQAVQRDGFILAS